MDESFETNDLLNSKFGNPIWNAASETESHLLQSESLGRTNGDRYLSGVVGKHGSLTASNK